MKSSPARIAALTTALLVAGGALGALAAAVGLVIAGAITEHDFPPLEILAVAMLVGGALGAPLLPATSWLLLRRVPLGLSWLGTTVGTVAGGVAAWVAAAFMSGDPILWAVTGAVIGFFFAVIVLRARFPVQRDRVRVPGAANVTGG